ncbi:MAG: beta strand repeat-containing protein [Solirubrobacteraceae bacterium]
MGFRRFVALVGLLAAVSLASPALAAGCTATWTGGTNTDWNTAANWSPAGVPGNGSDVCIGGTGGPFNVVVQNITVNIASLTVGGSSTLTIGNSGSGTAIFNVSGAVQTALGGTIAFGFGGTFTAATLTNAGTFQVPNSSYGGTINLGNATNTGTFSVLGGGASLVLAGGSTFANSGTISSAAGTLAVSSTSGTGTLQLQSGGVVNDIGSSGSVSVADRVALGGGSICGNPLQIGSGDGGTGGTLAFASSPGSGPGCGGLPAGKVFIPNVTATMSGTIPAGYTVTVGDGGSGYFALALSGNVVNDGTFAPGFGGTVSSPSSSDLLTNNGTVTVQPSGYTTNLNFPLVNNGQLTFPAAATASLNNGWTWENASTGKITVGSGISAVVEDASGQAGTVQFDQGSFETSSGTFAVGSRLAVNGGSICGNGVQVGSGDGGTGGTLAFATTPGTGPGCPAGAASGRIFIANVAATMSGTIPSGDTVTVGDGGAGYFALALSGNVVNDGTFAPGFGGTVSSASSGDSLTNNGTVTVQPSGYTTALNFPLVNHGQLTFPAAATASLDNGRSWQNTGTIAVPSGVTVSVSSPTGQSGAFAQAGVIESLGAFDVAAAVTINGGTTCGNGLNIGSGDGGSGGALSFAPQPTAGPPCPSGQATDVVSILNVTATLGTSIAAGYTVRIGDPHASYANVNAPGGLTNAGTLEPGWGATLTVKGTLTNVGRIAVPASGYTTTIAGNLTNAGSLDLGTDRLTVNGNYIQGSNGQLFVTINGVQAGGTGFGQLGVQGTAALAGALTIQVAAGFVPTQADTFEIVQAKSVSGQFASVTVQGGAGSSFAYAPNYASSAVSVSSTLPPPVLGKTANVTPVSGMVFVRLPGHAAGDQEHGALSKGFGFVPLTAARQLPSGSQIDSRLGTLSIATVASAGHGKLQAATLGGAIFGVSQSAHGLTKGLTTFALLEGDFPGAPSYTSCGRPAADHGSPSARGAKGSPKVLQTLKASDKHGRFATKGRYSAATVRGTQWITQDRCNGTLTIVKRGTVSVFSTVTRRTVTVHAGHSFLARA